MRASRVQVSWDAAKNQWLVRIEVGAEVIRRHCPLPKSASEDQLRESAARTAVDEGYTVENEQIAVAR